MEFWGNIGLRMLTHDLPTPQRARTFIYNDVFSGVDLTFL